MEWLSFIAILILAAAIESAGNSIEKGLKVAAETRRRGRQEQAAIESGQVLVLGNNGDKLKLGVRSDASRRRTTSSESPPRKFSTWVSTRRDET